MKKLQSFPYPEQTYVKKCHIRGLPVLAFEKVKDYPDYHCDFSFVYKTSKGYGVLVHGNFHGCCAVLVRDGQGGYLSAEDVVRLKSPATNPDISSYFDFEHWAATQKNILFICDSMDTDEYCYDNISLLEGNGILDYDDTENLHILYAEGISPRSVWKKALVYWLHADGTDEEFHPWVDLL